MKTVIKGALALVLLASTATAALAQDNEREPRRESRGDGSYNPAMRASSRNVPPSLQERQPAPQAQAPQAPQAPQPQAQPQPQTQAQPQGQSQGRQGGRRGDSNWQSRQPAGDQQAQQPPQNGGQHWNNGQGGHQGQSWQGQQNNNNQGQRHDRNNDRRDDRNPGWNNNGSNNNNGWNHNGWNHNGWNSNGWNNNGWNNNGRDWRPDRNQQRPRFDRRHYGQNFHSQQRYRGYAYRPPSGFYIRSWGYGDLLPRSWWSNQYRLNDWWSYGLPIPPIGYEYVRVGDDVLLVDMFSGRVVQMIRDVFW